MAIREDKLILVAQDLNGSIQKGIIKVKEKEFFVAFHLKSKSNLSDARFRCDWELKALLHGYEDMLKKRLQSCKTIAEFLNEVHYLATTLLSERERRTGSKTLNKPSSFIENILTEMEKIGWNKVQFLDPSFTSFRLSAKDSSSREHVLHIRFNSEDLFEKPSYQTDFPFSFHPKLSPQDGVLIPVYQEFVQELALYQDFWNNMDELDENCWILEAEARLRSCNYRRIALGNHCSVVLSIDPKQPRSFPEFRFLGADHIVIPLREKLNRNLFRWDQDKSILENLEMLFESKLPSPEQANSQDSCMDCSICYAYRLNNEIPEKTCDDSRCGKSFHTSCLVEWLRSLPNFRQSFNVLFGECPHCSKPMTVKTGRKRQRDNMH